MLRIASIGECMIEIQDMADGTTRRTFGGDTLNVAVYARRALGDLAACVSYVSALGDDPFSLEMLDFIAAEAIDTSTVLSLPGQLPGLYAITLENGERKPWFWRSEAAARQLVQAPAFADLCARLEDYHALYFSGITLGILDPDSRTRLLAFLGQMREAGKTIVFDTNYRPRLWQSQAEAQQAVTDALRVCTLALPTFEDEQALFGDTCASETIARIQRSGVGEVVVKQGAEPCLGRCAQSDFEVAPLQVSQPVDTTAAGDSFNGAYIAARLSGQSAEQAAAKGHRMASHVIGYRGAIVPRLQP